MASGDNLLHRGKLTRGIVEGFRALLNASPRGRLLADEVYVAFLDNNASELAVMPLASALEAVTYDVAIVSYHGKTWDWSTADFVQVCPRKS